MQPEHDTRESGLAGRHGCLYLVPGPLDHGCASQAPLTDVLPQQTLAVAARLTHWISENARSTRAFLKRVDALVPLARPLQEIEITELPRAARRALLTAVTGSVGAGAQDLSSASIPPIQGLARRGRVIRPRVRSRAQEMVSSRAARLRAT